MTPRHLKLEIQRPVKTLKCPKSQKNSLVLSLLKIHVYRFQPIYCAHMTLTIIRTGNNHNLSEQLCMKNTFILTDTRRLVIFLSRKSKSVGNPLSYYYDHRKVFEICLLNLIGLILYDTNWKNN